MNYWSALVGLFWGFALAFTIAIVQVLNSDMYQHWQLVSVCKGDYSCLCRIKEESKSALSTK